MNKLLFSCVNNAALEVFKFEKLNFSKTTVAYGTFYGTFKRSVLTENNDYIWKNNYI